MGREGLATAILGERFGRVKEDFKEFHCGTSLAVQWLRIHASNAGGLGLIPGRGIKIPHAPQRGQKTKKKGFIVHWVSSTGAPSPQLPPFPMP